MNKVLILELDNNSFCCLSEFKLNNLVFKNIPIKIDTGCNFSVINYFKLDRNQSIC